MRLLLVTAHGFRIPAESHHVELRQATNEVVIVARLQSINVDDGALVKLGHATTALTAEDFPLRIEYVE